MIVIYIKLEFLYLFIRYLCKLSLLKVLVCLGVINDVLFLIEKIVVVDNFEEDYFFLGGGVLLGCLCFSD